jgi:lambda repressor-like predicted transcriptional regulator
MPNERLRSAMRENGVTIKDLARTVGVDEKTVTRWLEGRTPYPRHREAVATHLGHEQATLWPTVFVKKSIRVSLASADPLSSSEETAETQFYPMTEHIDDALSVGGARATLRRSDKTNGGDATNHMSLDVFGDEKSLTPFGGAVFGAGRIDADYVQVIRASSQHFVALDSMHGGNDIFPFAVRIFRTAHGKLGRVPLSVAIQRELEATTGEAGEVAAWLAYDADQQSLSRQIYEALLLSRLAGDRQMELFELTHLAMQSIYLNRPREAMRIADDAIDNGRLAPRVAALFDIRRGRAFSQCGERERAFDTLDRARSALTGSIANNDPKWTWWVDDAELIWHRAMAHAELGEWRLAVPLFKEAADLRAGYRRASYNDAVHFLDALVRVHAWQDAEQVIISDVMPRVGEVGSMRSTNLLLRIIERIEKSRNAATSTLVDSAVSLRRFIELAA